MRSTRSTAISAARTLCVLRRAGATWLLAISLSSCTLGAFDCANAITAGAATGMTGGATQAARYATLLLVGATCALIRSRRFPHTSCITEVIQQRFGVLSGMLFQAIITYRLYTLVWANAGAIADFYAPPSRRHDTPWWIAVALSMGVALLVTAQGGMRASLYADGLLGLISLCGILAVAVHAAVTSPSAVANVSSRITGTSVSRPALGTLMQENSAWGLSAGSDALLVIVLESATSFGFYDPLMTDRAFLGSPRRMMSAFTAGALLAALKAFALCFIGVRAYALATAGGSVGGRPSSTLALDANAMSLAALPWKSYQVLTLVWLASGLSALVATLSAFSKAWALDMQRLIYGSLAVLTPERAQSGAVWAGRTAAAFFAMVATLPLLTNNAPALRATFATGMPVLGLGWPLIYAAVTPRRRNAASPLVFLLPLCCSIAVGLSYQISTTPRSAVAKAPNLQPIVYSLLPDAFLIGSGAQKHRLAWTLLILGGSGLLCAAAAAVEAILARRVRDESITVGGDSAALANADVEAPEGGAELDKENSEANLHPHGDDAAVAAACAKAAELAKNPAMLGEDPLSAQHAVSRRSGLAHIAGVRFSRSSRGADHLDDAEQHERLTAVPSSDGDDVDLYSGLQRRISNGLQRLVARISGARVDGPGDAISQRVSQHHAGDERQVDMQPVSMAVPDGLRPRKSLLGNVPE